MTAQGSLGEKALGWKLKPWLYLFLCFESKFFFFLVFGGLNFLTRKMNCWVCQKAHSGFSIRCYGKTNMNILGNPIQYVPGSADDQTNARKEAGTVPGEKQALRPSQRHSARELDLMLRINHLLCA